jgi:hypothetical protein
MKDRLAYKYTGQTNPDGSAAEMVMGVPSSDIRRSQFDAMSDAEKALLHESPIHKAYGSADEEAEAAAERVHEAEEHPAPAPAVAPAPSPTPAPDPKVAPKAEVKK